MNYFLFAIVFLALIVLQLEVRKLKTQFLALATDLETFIGYTNDYAKANNLRVRTCEESIKTLDFQESLIYYDLTNHLHKAYHLRENDDGDLTPHRYTWTLDEECRLLELKQRIDMECTNRGIPLRDFSKLQGL